MLSIKVLVTPLATLGCLALLVVPASGAPGQPVRDVAIVAHPGVPVDELSLAEVRRLFLGERQFWNPSLKVTLLMRVPVAHERDVILRTIYRMSEAQYRQYWISKVFRAETVAGPKVVYSSEMALELVGMLPGAIAFVEASQSPKNSKVLRIDGRLPGQPGYPLN